MLPGVSMLLWHRRTAYRCDRDYRVLCCVVRSLAQRLLQSKSCDGMSLLVCTVPRSIPCESLLLLEGVPVSNVTVSALSAGACDGTAALHIDTPITPWTGGLSAAGH